ncbi:MAG: Zn-dependent hydrolase [Natronomonas sp.]
MDFQIEEERFEETFEEYSEIGGTPNGGLHRLALTDADRVIRDRFVSDLEALGLDVSVDEVGNVFGRREGTADLAPVFVGSHLDSQPYGGRFDGQLGVLTALETVRTLEEHDVSTDRPIVVVNWTNEEGARFAPALMGSSAFTGRATVEETLSTPDEYEGEVTLGEELERIGYDGDRPCKPGDVHSYLELHVECGPELEENENRIGIVDAIYASTWLEVTVRGESKHAGPTPMADRRDAFAAASVAVQGIVSIPTRIDNESVVTVGEVHVSPNKRNIIPDEVTFSVDFRSASDEVVEEAKTEVERALKAASRDHGTSYEIEEIMAKDRTEFASTVTDAVEAATSSFEYPYQYIESVAGHDAMPMNDIAKAGMVMVPSVGGECHTESEFTRMEDCLAGANVLANATYTLATES